MNYTDLGETHQLMGEHAKTRAILMKCLNIQQTLLNNSDLESLTFPLGKLFYYAEDYSQALRYFEKSLEIEKKILLKKHPLIGLLYSYIGEIKRLTGDYSSALSFFRRALEIQEEPAHDSIYLALTYNFMDETYRKMHKYSSALEFHKKVLDIRRKVLPSTHPLLVTTRHNLANVYKEMKQYKLANEHAQKAVEIVYQKLPKQHPHIFEYRETLKKNTAKL